MNPLAVFAITLAAGIAVGLLRSYALTQAALTRDLAAPRPLRPMAPVQAATELAHPTGGIARAA